MSSANPSPSHSLCRRKVSQLFQSVIRSARPKKQASCESLASTCEGSNLPDLPLELWIHILREATALYPDPLDTTRAVSFIDDHHSQLRHSNYLLSLRQKQRLCLVNTFWNHYAREFLYEFVWIKSASEARSLAHSLVRQSEEHEGIQNGRFIRRLHIQTTALDKCDPRDLRTILDYSPHLTVYSDYRSVRRSLVEEACDPRSSSEQLFKALAHPNNNLRRLSWTNYDDISFHLRMSPMLEATAANLEFLELNFCSTHLDLMFDATTSDSISSALHLPALRTLKVTLDNATFSVLSKWELPALQNLSVVSADFSYAGPGFSQFFMVHGPKLIQLELGHSSSMIEEHYLTSSTNNQHPPSIPLVSWVPNLKEFICSADTEWSWENPDWIAPHVLLPAHPTLEFIGIRDIDKRLQDDLSFAVGNGTAISVDDDSAYFSIFELFGSLLGAATFPNLRYIRDLSEGSDVMRRRKSQVGVLRFWNRVLEKCKERGIWLEDCEGINVTKRDLLRFGLSRL